MNKKVSSEKMEYGVAFNRDNIKDRRHVFHEAYNSIVIYKLNYLGKDKLQRSMESNLNRY